MTRRTRGPCGLALVLFLLVSGPLSATQGASDPIARAHVVTTPPIIDGRLTDPVWQTVEPVTGFVQRELHEGQPATERTEVRILTDGQALYVGAWLYDTDPSGIVPGEKVRDGDISKSDYFGILLDTYHDRQNGFVFTTTPAAIEYDAQVVNEGEGGGIQLPGQTRASAGSLMLSSAFPSPHCATLRVSNRRGDSTSCARSAARMKNRSGRSYRASSR